MKLSCSRKLFRWFGYLGEDDIERDTIFRYTMLECMHVLARLNGLPVVRWMSASNPSASRDLLAMRGKSHNPANVRQRDAVATNISLHDYGARWPFAGHLHTRFLTSASVILL